MNYKPIGILDSGLGGLSVWRKIKELLPHESTVYIADSKNIPYGERSKEDIFQLSRKMVEFLIQNNVKIIIVACNTITVSCIHKLRIEFSYIPIIGTVPVIKKAAEISKNKRIGIFSTTRTTKSKYQKKLIEIYASECKVISQGSDEIVPLIERGKLNSPDMQKVLSRTLLPFKISGIDVLCLGCTHFPFIEKEIQEIIGKKITLLEPSSAIARHTKNVLVKINKLAKPGSKIKHKVYTTGDAELFNIVAKTLLGVTIQAQTVDL